MGRSAHLKRAQRGARGQYPGYAHNRVLSARRARGARLKCSDLPICKRGSARATRAIPGYNMPITGYCPRAPPARACKWADPPICKRGSVRAARAIPGYAHNRVCRAARARRAQKPELPISRRQAARAGNTRFAHKRDVARGARGARKRPARAIPGSPITGMSRGARAARAKTRSAHLKAAGGARGQYSVRP